MSLKSIDLQLSMSRMMDAGNMQNQMAQKPGLDQAAAAMQAMRQQELERSKSTQTEKSSEGKIRDREHKGGSGEPEGGSKDGSDAQEQKKPPYAKHPYKGKIIDLSL